MYRVRNARVGRRSMRRSVTRRRVVRPVRRRQSSVRVRRGYTRRRAGITRRYRR